MIFYVHGRFVPEEEANVSVLDRGFLYGDGLFETMRAARSVFPLFELHWERFSKGAEFLGIEIPVTSSELQKIAIELVRRNKMAGGIVRITLSRGVGQRGYSTVGADCPTLVLTAHLVPQPKSSLKVVVSKFRLPVSDPIAAVKNCNKMRQILARAEADHAGADEAILLNEDGNAVEGSSTNLFWFESETLCTPPLCAGILPGVTRTVILELATGLGWKTAETTAGLEQLGSREGIFLSSSAIGCLAVDSIDGKPVRLSDRVPQLNAALSSRLGL
jgi:branched-chain amino acid aminotransferase